MSDPLHLPIHTRLRGAGVPFPVRLADTWFGDVVVLSNGGEPMSANQGCGIVALCIVALGPVVAFVLGSWLEAPDFARVMAILGAICVPLAIYVWWAMRRYWRIGELINRGAYDRARRALGDGQSAVFGPLIGLLAQLRADHALAAEAYGWSLGALLPVMGSGSFPVELQASRKIVKQSPTTRQTFLRGAIALANVGRIEEARGALGLGENAGSYDATLTWVAEAYVQVCAGGTLFPEGPATAREMVSHFREIRGAWAGLALAGFGLCQLGETAESRALVEEELSRPGAEHLPAIFPRLRHFLESRGAALN